MKELIKWARAFLRDAQRDIATGVKTGFGVAALPFDSRLNIYDRDVHETTKSLLESKGEDKFILNAAVNSSIGRKVVPENSVEELSMELYNLRAENIALKKELGRG
jgi:hypothetical protein